MSWNPWTPFRPAAPPPPPPVDRPLWTMMKDARSARAVLRDHPLGTELRMLVASELLWSRVFRPGQEQALADEAETARLRLLERGWTVAT